jgi:hypothetical protein
MEPFQEYPKWVAAKDAGDPENPGHVLCWDEDQEASVSGIERPRRGRPPKEKERRMAGINAPIATLKSGTGQRSAGSGPAWVSGYIASLAALGVATVVFDLGPNFDQYVIVQYAVSPLGPSSGLSAVAAFSSDTIALDASGPASILARPMGRYFIVQATNADAVNALGAASFVRISAYPV